MNKLFVAAIALSFVGATAASADPRDNNQDNRGGHDHWDSHDNGQAHPGWGQDQGSGHHWSRGQRMGYNDWNSAPVVDYRQHHLRHPPRGYEWRESNGQYVLAAIATGLIASIILNSGR